MIGFPKEISFQGLPAGVGDGQTDWRRRQESLRVGGLERSREGDLGDIWRHDW